MSNSSKSGRSARGGSQSSSDSPAKHFNDWPNVQGFDVSYEERIPIELQVTGSIPSYAAGVFFRTAIGPRHLQKDADGKVARTTNHWFDGMSQVHRFQLHAPADGSEKINRITYNSRLTSDGLIDRIQKTGKMEQYTFAAKYDPCRSLFNKVQSMFEPSEELQASVVNNAVAMSVNLPGLSSDGSARHSSHSKSNLETVCTRTDASRIQMLDPETLEPIGLARQTVLHPDLKGALSATHAKSDPVTGDVYNFNLDIHGPKSTYRVFRTSAATGKTCVLATIKHAPAYLHSIFLSKNYVILCVWNSHVKAGGLSVLYNKNFLDSLYHNSKTPAAWYVIDKRDPSLEGGKGCVAIYESDPFFAFHSINAWEVKSETSDGIDIVADIPAWQNMDILHTFYLDNLLSNSPAARKQSTELREQGHESNMRAKIRRYRLPNVPVLSSSSSSNEPSTTRTPKVQDISSLSRHKATIDQELPASSSCELPTLNFNRICKPYRYVYGIMSPDGTKSTFVDGLVKYDWKLNETKYWIKEGHTPGEAIFIPNPYATSDDDDDNDNNENEDDGVLLTVVLDGHKGSSYLMVLDAKTFTEIGRVDVPGPIGFGFHGVFTKLNSSSSSSLSTSDDMLVKTSLGVNDEKDVAVAGEGKLIADSMIKNFDGKEAAGGGILTSMIEVVH